MVCESNQRRERSLAQQGPFGLMCLVFSFFMVVGCDGESVKTTLDYRLVDSVAPDDGVADGALESVDGGSTQMVDGPLLMSRDAAVESMDAAADNTSELPHGGME